MNIQDIPVQQDSNAWVLFSKASFAISLIAMTIGIVRLPLDIWIRGFLGMGMWFVVASTITLSKTLRDQHEARQLIHRVQQAKTEKIIKDMAA